MTVLTEKPPTSLPILQEVTEQRTVYIAHQPVTFQQFLDLFGEDDDVELVQGVIERKMAAQLDHESLFAWLITVLNYYVSARQLGVVFGSRLAVRIGEHGARLPDLLFIRQERLGILRAKGVEGTPDLVIELVSPGDRPSDLVTLEADYRTIAVPEIVFIDRNRQHIRTLRRDSNGDYSDEIISGSDNHLSFASLPGVHLNAGYLLGNERPLPPVVVEALLAE